MLEEKAGLKYNEVKDLYSNISLILQCSHFITHNVQSLVPNVVDVGGIHCRPGKKLPDELDYFLDTH